LGRDIPNTNDSLITKKGGGVGVSWRIPDASYGKDIATGLLKAVIFIITISCLTFGASGMTWRGNHFYNNEKYG